MRKASLIPLPFWACICCPYSRASGLQPILSMFRKMDECQAWYVGSGTFCSWDQRWGTDWDVILVGCDMGQRRADVDAHVKSLFLLNEMLVSEVHIDGSVIQNDINASILCRSQKGGSRVSVQVIVALIVSSPQKSLVFVVGAVFSTLLLVTNHTKLFWHVWKVACAFHCSFWCTKNDLHVFLLPLPALLPPPVFCFRKRLSWLPSLLLKEQSWTVT